MFAFVNTSASCARQNPVTLVTLEPPVQKKYFGFAQGKARNAAATSLGRENADRFASLCLAQLESVSRESINSERGRVGYAQT
jgi:murein tripeptide amidase MpaA